jgi:hypothetical protein
MATPMSSSTDRTSESPQLGPTPGDKLFMVFLVLVVTETAKSNGEAWVAWLTEAGTTRFDANTTNQACKGGVKPAADAKAGSAGTWGACLAHIMATTELKDQINTFFNQAPHFVAACVPSDRTLMGAILLEDLVPTPPGSATPFVATQLVEADPIDYKMQLRLSVCDKGGYAIKVAEFEF